ncbi:MAG: cobyric acid synthase [Thermodesulfobacteriota bacterium]
MTFAGKIIALTNDTALNDLGHGGHLAALARRAGCAPEAILDFSASLNPLGPPEWLRPVISRTVARLAHYPDPRGEGLLAPLAACLGLAPAQLVLGNGATELLYGLPRALPCRRALIPVPSYGDYQRAAQLAGLEVVCLPLAEAQGFRLDLARLAETLQPGDLVFLGQPNNPTGLTLAATDLLALAAASPRVFFAVDESFFEFVSPQSVLMTAAMPANLVVIRSLTKLWAIPGLRLGLAAGHQDTIALLRHQLPPWTVNTLALAVGEALVADPDYGERSRQQLPTLRAALSAGLAALPGLTVYPGEANFLLVRLERSGLAAASLAQRLLTRDPARPIAIRVCANFTGLDERFFRVAVRTAEENGELCAALARELLHGAPAIRRSRRTPALMLQGTSSHAGKSVLTYALGRILLEDGFRVAPFKAQNMSLNSHVTRDGGEMGRAQVLQAQACRLDPDLRMNPVLLKPSGDLGCQVIVQGRPVGQMSVEEYIRFKPEAARAACAAYDSLAAEHEVILLEGAGSPAEVNLRQHDIVNMAMARHAAAPVLLVGDIDRGGVFAAFLVEPDVHLRRIRHAADLAAAGPELAALILPGSKNVIADLGFLVQSGLGAGIADLAGQGRVELVGICGGFQMLGRAITDPLGLESPGAEASGLGLLPVTTVLAADKTLAQRTGRHLASGQPVRGYEIHHGVSHGEAVPAVALADGTADGASSADGLVWGSYLHGIFDSDPFRRWLIDRLRLRQGLAPAGRLLAAYDLEPALDRLADEVRKAVDLGRIYQLMGLG